MRVLARTDLAGLHDADVHDRLRAGPLRVGDPDGARRRADPALVPHLPAGLRVERRPRQEQTDLLALLGDGELAVLRIEQRHDGALGLGLCVPHELRRRHGARVQADRHLLRVAPRALLLLLQQLVEPVRVHRRPRVLRQLQGELEREAERVRELERVLSAHPSGGGAPLRVFEQGHPLAEGLREALLLLDVTCAHEREVLAQLRVGVAEPPLDHVDEGWHHRALDAQPPGVRDDAAKHPAQDVAAALVRGLHAVGDQERRRARVLPHDPDRDVVALVRAVVLPDSDCTSSRIGAEQIRLEEAAHVLQRDRHALDAGARVDVLRRQLVQDLRVRRRPRPA